MANSRLTWCAKLLLHPNQLIKLLILQVKVELPFPGSVKYIHATDSKFMNKIPREQKMYSVHYHHNEAWWTRCCVQVWNEVSPFLYSTGRCADSLCFNQLEDFDKIGKAWIEVCNATLKEIQGGEVEGDADSCKG